MWASLGSQLGMPFAILSYATWAERYAMLPLLGLAGTAVMLRVTGIQDIWTSVYQVVDFVEAIGMSGDLASAVILAMMLSYFWGAIRASRRMLSFKRGSA